MAKLNEILIPSNRRLFNLLFRHQLYLEGIKAGFAGDYVRQIKDLFNEFAKFFFETRYSNMDEFTKGQLLEFVRKFDKAQKDFYNSYTQRLIELLKIFLSTDVRILRTMFEDLTGSLPHEIPNPEKPVFGNNTIGGTKETNSKLWAAIANEIVPASGYKTTAQIDAFTITVSRAVLNVIQQGYANNWTITQTLNAIGGSPSKRFRDGLMGRFARQNEAMLNTVIQHISANAQTAIASKYFSLYQWVSIIDQVTTEVCLDRNGQIYVYGEGPLPPAHYNCRSVTIPVTGDETHPTDETYYAWLFSQPAELQNDLLGETKAAQFRSGDLKAKDFRSINVVKPLTLSQYAEKIKFILGE